MAGDAELLARAEKSPGNAVLSHSYAWSSPAVSVPRSFRGRVNMKTLEEGGIAFVRRPTGGAVLVHGFDVSYAAAVGRTGAWGRMGWEEICFMLATPVLHALREAGYDAFFRGEAGKPGAAGGRTGLCFAQTSAVDILARGNGGAGLLKVAAFAQRRTARGILEHGSAFLEEIPEGVINTLVKAGLGSPAGWRGALRGVGWLANLPGGEPGKFREALFRLSKTVSEMG